MTLSRIPAVVFGLALVLAACASGNGEEAESLIPPEATIAALGDIPEEQRWAFEDGTVTVEEYQKGFDAFRSCVEEQGQRLVGVSIDPTTGLIEYGIPASGPDVPRQEDPLQITAEECYLRWFQEIDATYQTMTPAVLEAALEEDRRRLDRDMRPCLQANGIEVGDVSELGRQALDRFSLRYVELFENGACPEAGR